MKKIIASVAIAFAAIVNAAGLPEGEFRDPSVANRPETWFHFIGGNVAKPGITADLEAIKGAGISGIHLFHGQFGGKRRGRVQTSRPHVHDAELSRLGDERRPVDQAGERHAPPCLGAH